MVVVQIKLIQAATEAKAPQRLKFMQNYSQGLPVLTTIASTSSSEVPSAHAYTTTQL